MALSLILMLSPLRLPPPLFSLFLFAADYAISPPLFAIRFDIFFAMLLIFAMLLYYAHDADTMPLITAVFAADAIAASAC